jgi:hypothetical protein
MVGNAMEAQGGARSVKHGFVVRKRPALVFFVIGIALGLLTTGANYLFDRLGIEISTPAFVILQLIFFPGSNLGAEQLGEPSLLFSIWTVGWCSLVNGLIYSMFGIAVDNLWQKLKAVRRYSDSKRQSM